MKTAKGNNYAILLGISINDKKLTLPLKEWLDLNTDTEYLTKMQEDIAARIILNTKPSGTLQKQLERIEHHKEQMIDAYKLLFACYHTMISPATRQSPIDKARYEMLSLMDVKMLRNFAAHYLNADDYVLPDERERLITAVIAAARDQST